jgi:hypothetical protein
MRVGVRVCEGGCEGGCEGVGVVGVCAGEGEG